MAEKAAGRIGPRTKGGGKGRVRWVLGLALAGVVLLAGLLGLAYYLIVDAADSTLRRAVAEADRDDPGWRLDSLERQRAAIPDGRNSAIRVRAVLDLLPAGWSAAGPRAAVDPGRGGPGRGEALVASLHAPPEVQLDAGRVADLRAELGRAAAAVAEARGLAGMPEGRYPIAYAPIFFMTPLEHSQRARDVAQLLWMDVLLRAQDGDVDGALDSCRALLNVGRSLGDEPMVLTQVVRMSIASIALDGVQRVLAQGEPSDAALARVEELLADEAGRPLALYAIRGERAGIFAVFDELASGRAQPNATGSARPAPGGPVVVSPRSRLTYRYNQGLALGFLNRAAEIARRPATEQPGLWSGWNIETRAPNPFLAKLYGTMAYRMVPAVGAVADLHLRCSALLAAARLMVALERHRRASDTWPEDIKDLVPTLLKALPDDPYNARPVRVARREDGLAVYSVGPDRQDNNGTFDEKLRTKPGTDLGYALWDVSRRRQPPEPKPSTTPTPTTTPETIP